MYFYDKESPKVDANHTSLALINLDSALEKDEHFYPQVFLKECKCNKKNVIRRIIDELQISSVLLRLMIVLMQNKFKKLKTLEKLEKIDKKKYLKNFLNKK